MPASAKALGPATRNARDEVKAAIWLTVGVSTLEPAGEAGRRHDVARPPDPGAAALAMGDQHCVAEARRDRRGAMARMDHERAAADRGASTRLGVMSG